VAFNAEKWNALLSGQERR